MTKKRLLRVILFPTICLIGFFLFSSFIKAEECGCSYIESCRKLSCPSCEESPIGDCSYLVNNSCAGPSLPCTTSCINGVCQAALPPPPPPPTPPPPSPPPAADACTNGVCCNTAADPNEFYGSNRVCDSWVEYGCYWGTSCGQDVGQKTVTKYCSGTSADCTGNTFSSTPSISENCDSWEICDSNTHSCNCAGVCLATPANPNPPNDAQNVKLPVTLRWDTINGANSYQYKIDGVIEGVTTTPYITIGNCTLHSSSTYNWQVQACCDSGGGSCGPWSNLWTFKTSLAPELVSPENNSTNVPVPVTFTWCGVGAAQSYYLQRYEEGTYVPPFLITKENDALPTTISMGFPFFTKNATYAWEAATCLNPNGTKCGFDCRDNQEGNQCGDYSQRWNFTTMVVLPPPNLDSPKMTNGIPVVNFSHYLGWKEVTGVRSYRYQIKEGENEVLNTSTLSTAVYLIDIWDNLNFNTVYTWNVKSCWDEEGNNCEEERSEEWSFKTTGASPTNLKESPITTDGKVSIPATLSWDKMPGALSYYYEISTAPNFSLLAATNTTDYLKSEDSVDYPKLKTGTQYWWRVKTCADSDGKICGPASTQSFTTFNLSLPINPNPQDNGELLTSQKYIRWDPVLGARFYQYKVDYGGAEKIPPTIVSINSVLLPIDKMDLGNYTWYVKACLDQSCQESGGLAGPWRFNLIQGECEKSLVPCGRDCDAPGTPYNERDSCQFKHIFLLLNNILDFVLWRLGLIVLVLLAIATGVIYYFSMGAPQTMVKVKTLLKSAGVGYGIIFLGWLIINWILIILGYQVGIFGRWWQIIF